MRRAGEAANAVPVGMVSPALLLEHGPLNDSIRAAAPPGRVPATGVLRHALKAMAQRLRADARASAMRVRGERRLRDLSTDSAARAALSSARFTNAAALLYARASLQQRAGAVPAAATSPPTMSLCCAAACSRLSHAKGGGGPKRCS